MLISDLHCSTVIGCGGKLNQSEWDAEAILRGWWEKNQCFMLISDIHCSTVIGCGGELKQSEWGVEST